MKGEYGVWKISTELKINKIGNSEIFLRSMGNFFQSTIILSFLRTKIYLILFSSILKLKSYLLSIKFEESEY